MNNKNEDPKDMIPRDVIEVYFSEISGLHPIRVKCDTVDICVIKDGFLKIHDKTENHWHCYNINHIIHFHFPGEAVKSNDKIKH